MKTAINSNTLKTEQTHTHNIKFNWPTVVFLLIMIGIPALPGLFILMVLALGPNAIEGVSSMINFQYFDTPLPILLHAGSGLLFFITTPFQFSHKLRINKPALHKKAGYTALISAYVMSLSGLWMHYVFNGSNFDQRFFALGLQSLCLFFAYAMAVAHILSKKVQLHRLWISRAVAIAISLVTLLFVEVAFILVLGQQVAQGHAQLISVLHNYGNLIGMTINLAVIEYVNRKS